MYESFFGLNRRPFCFAPAVDRYFPVANSDTARQALARCIDRAEGVALLVAAPGMGKTLLLQVLADQFRDRFPLVQLGTGQIETRRELLQSLAHDLRVPFRGLDDGELRLAVTNYLLTGDRCPQGILILADEAHTFNFGVLDELRMLTNAVKDGEPRVRLVLSGNLRLEEALTDPRLESLNQRIVCRRYLERFDSSETAEYIRFQIAAAGGQVERVFEPAARDAVFQATDGIPRLINQLCDFAMLTAYTDDRQPITSRGIEIAWAELQQLPGQWMDPPAKPQLRVSSSDDDVIEYGGLSEDDADEVTLTGSGSIRTFSGDDDADEDDFDSIASQHSGAQQSGAQHSAPQQPAANVTIGDAERRAEAEFDAIEAQLTDVLRQHAVGKTSAKQTPEQPQQSRSPGAFVPYPAQPKTVDATDEDLFEVEEVVIDRYAELEADVRKQLPPQAQAARKPTTPETNPSPTTGKANSAPPQAIPGAIPQKPAPKSASFVVEEDEDRLQVFVDPYGDFFAETEDDAEDVAVEAPTALATPETDDAWRTELSQELSVETETRPLPPMARPAPQAQRAVIPTANTPATATPVTERPRLHRADDADDQLETDQSRAAADDAAVAQTGDVAADIDDDTPTSRPGPVLIIEDDDDEPPLGQNEFPAHGSHQVKLDDYRALFARLRGEQAATE